MHIHLKHPSGLVKETKVGFSWTVFFFGFFPPFFRGDWKWGLIILILSSFTFGLSNIVFWFIYNKLYIKDLLEAGYSPADEHSRSVLVMKGYIADDPR
ncbi:hypothetical protein SAMN05421734_10735 [Pelagirhabdus alkalitolerans]|uniref:HrgC protein n=1 Tax=Pelagirhabdus alkalitolerans TaxID=1612202 RepID=A0A1G6KYY7_9BACI|nr:hypothetical protein [Pelagirhabdus alkalitolerans]SDC36174.1 hypothetical protein SAMN05421734_10735 [Pelagirhabdus alkalitolerans]